MCKNVKVQLSDGVLVPLETLESGLDLADRGYPGICVPDNGSGMGGLTSKDTGPGGNPAITLDAKVTPTAATPTPAVATPARPWQALLVPNQAEFGARLVADTGLDPYVVAAWLLSEESAGAAQSRQAANNNDWLNIGYTDSGTYGSSDSIWSNPTTAADATKLVAPVIRWFTNGALALTGLTATAKEASPSNCVYEAATENFTSRVMVLFACLSVILISRR